jgi:hypothetical protein
MSRKRLPGEPVDPASLRHSGGAVGRLSGEEVEFAEESAEPVLRDGGFGFVCCCGGEDLDPA